jgi:hypothetical protein
MVPSGAAGAENTRTPGDGMPPFAAVSASEVASPGLAEPTLVSKLTVTVAARA